MAGCCSKRKQKRGRARPSLVPFSGDDANLSREGHFKVGAGIADSNCGLTFSKPARDLQAGNPLHEDHSPPQTVAISYQIGRLSHIDIAGESSIMGIELTMIYEITEDDMSLYKQIEEDRLGFQQVVDLERSKRPKALPPILDVRNALESSVVCERIRADRDKASGRYFVSLYQQLTVMLEHSFEIEHFPFARELLDIFFVSKLPIRQLVFVPGDDASVLPPGKRRGNLYKSSKTVVNNWDVVNHYLQIWRLDELPPMPSGEYYHRFSVLVAVEYQASYVIWNVVLLVFLLSLLNPLAFLVEPSSMADRASIVLGITFVMAAYKQTICDELPKKPFLTRIDEYILYAFAMNIFTAGFCGIELLCIKKGALDEETTEKVEFIFVCITYGLWLALHIVFWLLWSLSGACPCLKHLFFMPWPSRRQIDVLEFKADYERLMKFKDDMARINARDKPTAAAELPAAELPPVTTKPVPAADTPVTAEPAPAVDKPAEHVPAVYKPVPTESVPATNQPFTTEPVLATDKPAEPVLVTNKPEGVAPTMSEPKVSRAPTEPAKVDPAPVASTLQPPATPPREEPGAVDLEDQDGAGSEHHRASAASAHRAHRRRKRTHPRPESPARATEVAVFQRASVPAISKQPLVAGMV